MQPEAGAAFFDLDRTLMRENSGALYALHEYRRGRLSTYQLLQSTYWLLLHRLSLLDVEHAYGRAVEHWRGVHVDDVRHETDAWFVRHVKHRLTPGGAAALSLHRSQQRPTVLLTNSSSFIAEAVCKHWQLDHWLANAIPSDEAGRIDGSLELPLCIGEGKVFKARAWARAHHVSLAESYFYADSQTDLPMLQCVGHPVAVNPDPVLRHQAKKRGWPVVEWS